MRIDGRSQWRQRLSLLPSSLRWLFSVGYRQSRGQGELHFVIFAPSTSRAGEFECRKSAK